MVWQGDVRGPGVRTVGDRGDGLVAFGRASVPPVPPVPHHQRGQVWTRHNQDWLAPKLATASQLTHTPSHC